MRILIVEDNLVILNMLEHVLEEERFIIEATASGKRAFDLAKDKNYNLIILDLLLPDMSGFDIIASLRSLNINTPILVISSLSSVGDRTKALDLGADDYMVKDLSVDEMLSRIKSLIRRSQGNAKNIYQCGNLMLNLSDMSVKRSNMEIYLTRKELALLVCLFQKKGKIVSKKELIKAGWGDENADMNSNKLNVHFKSLREKIDEAFENKYIHTYRGYGYRLDCLETPVAEELPALEV